MPPEEHSTYQCMEVWGGNQAADNGVVMPGVDAWVLGRPYADQTAGGDVHYVSSCATGRIARFLVADVSGHGTSVADLAGSLRTLMRRYINFIDQSRLVRELNREFTSVSQDGLFATAIIATYFTPTGYLTVCNAGHPRPLLYTAAERTWRILDPRSSASAGPVNIPLGIAEGVDYEQAGLRLRDGDLVLFYTDAIVEVMNPAGELLGEQGLLAIVRAQATDDTRRLLSGILAGVEAFGGRPKDDVTLLALRPNALRPRVSLVESLGALLRFVALTLNPFRPRDKPVPWPEMSVPNLGAFFPALNKRWGGGTPA